MKIEMIKEKNSKIQYFKNLAMTEEKKFLFSQFGVWLASMKATTFKY